MYDKCKNIFYVILEKDKLNYICVDFILKNEFFFLIYVYEL